MMSMVYPWFIYMFSLTVFMMSVHPMMVWVLMEINLLSFVILGYYKDLNGNFFSKESMFFYFIIQSLGSLIYLSSSSLSEELSLLNEFLFIVSISFKLGIFPFYFWTLVLGSSLSNLMFTLILTLQKVPMFIILFGLSCWNVFLLTLVSFIFGSFMLNFCTSICSLLVYSSVSSSFWIFILFCESFYMFVLFFLIYFILIWSLNCNFKGWETRSIEGLMFFMFLMGLPPLSLFFFKFYISFQMNMMYSNLFSILFWVGSFICLMGYLKFFQSLIMFNDRLYSKFFFNNIKILGFFSFMFFFYFF